MPLTIVDLPYDIHGQICWQVHQFDNDAFSSQPHYTRLDPYKPRPTSHLKNLSLVNKSFRAASIVYLFNGAHFVLRDGVWDKFEDGDLKQVHDIIMSSERLRRCVRTFNFFLFGDEPHYGGWREPEQDAKDEGIASIMRLIMPSIPDLLLSFPNLSSLRFSVKRSMASEMDAILSSMEPTFALSHVETLTLGPEMHFLVKFCPNLVHVHATFKWMEENFGFNGSIESRKPRQYSIELLEALEHAHLPKLEGLDIYEIWSPELLDAISKHIPKIVSLSIGCYLYGPKVLETYTSQLSRLRNLRTLVTDSLFSGPISCIVRIPTDAEREAERKRMDQGLHEVARIVFTACKSVEEIIVGPHARVTIDEKTKEYVVEVRERRDTRRDFAKFAIRQGNKLIFE